MKTSLKLLESVIARAPQVEQQLGRIDTSPSGLIRFVNALTGCQTSDVKFSIDSDDSDAVVFYGAIDIPRSVAGAHGNISCFFTGGVLLTGEPVEGAARALTIDHRLTEGCEYLMHIRLFKNMPSERDAEQAFGAASRKSKYERGTALDWATSMVHASRVTIQDAIFSAKTHGWN